MRLASSDFACFFGVFFGWRKKTGPKRTTNPHNKNQRKQKQKRSRKSENVITFQHLGFQSLPIHCVGVHWKQNWFTFNFTLLCTLTQSPKRRGAMPPLLAQCLPSMDWPSRCFNPLLHKSTLRGIEKSRSFKHQREWPLWTAALYF